MSNDIKKYMAIIDAAGKEHSKSSSSDVVLHESATALATNQEAKSIVSVDDLIDTLQAKGYSVLEEGGIRVIQSPEARVVIWEDGSMTRGDVPLDKMKPMTLDETVKYLGL